MSDLKPTVYIETTIPSYLTARPSRDVVRLAHQELTRAWWDQKERFQLFVSDLVELECSRGDPVAASERLQAIKEIERLPNAEELADLAKTLFEQIRLPANAQVDVEHLALCVFHKIEYLLTWNCRHLANAVLLSKLPELCRNLG